MFMPIHTRLSAFLLSTVAVGGVSIALAGCTSDSPSGFHGRNDYSEHDHARDASERVGERNTTRSDIQDDGRINGSARSYEERKASRSADEGDNDAARREAELRRDRLDR
jgi:hypothetical protein